MAGIRLTLDRQWPELFVKYPLPWRVENISTVGRHYALYYEAGITADTAVSDASGTALAIGQRHMVNYMLLDLYAYVVPRLGMTGMPLRNTMPGICRMYKLPWRMAEPAVASIFGENLLCSADTGVIRWWGMDDELQARACEIMLALSELVWHMINLRGDAGGSAVDAG